MSTSNPQVILCIDDETTGLSIRKLLLESQGYVVLTATNGADAVSIFSAQPVDLVVLDYMMPEMNGDVVAEKLKSARPSVPIVMLSAYVDLPRETLVFVDRCFTKGEGPVRLLSAIAELLSDSCRKSNASSAA